MNPDRRSPPVVVVMGADTETRLPGIEKANQVAELRFAPDLDELSRLLPDADALFVWRLDPTWLPGLWPVPSRIRWIQKASAGVDATPSIAMTAKAKGGFAASG